MNRFLLAHDILKKMIENKELIDPHALSLKHKNIPYGIWRFTANAMWEKEKMPGYTYDDRGGRRPTYYYVGKRKWFGFDWSSIFKFWR